MAFVFAAISMVGSLIQSREESAAAKEQAAIQDYEAEVANQNARIAGQRASAEQERTRRASRQVLGEQRAGIAQSGTAFSGSNLDIIRQSTTAAELDALNVQYEGEIERGNFLEQSKMSKYNATSLRNKAKNINRVSWFKAIGAGAEAYGGAGGKSYLGKQKGPG